MAQVNFGNRKNNDNRKGVPAKERARKREEAEARNAIFRALSLEERLEVIASRGGKPGCKEHLKIQRQIAERDRKAAAEVEQAAKDAERKANKKEGKKK